MQRLAQSGLIMFLVADAVLLLLFGRRWVRFTRFGHPSSAYYQLMTWFLKWPEAALRLFGALEVLLGLKLFRRWAR
ncbi:MAG: hypothetical protein RRC07_00060 [Anaerolineae bacterium]|nr:hypothetical protein [Anaerolineae bacterium]